MVNRNVIIIGGGVIGLGIGWQLAKAGLLVSIFERDRVGQGASWAAAGMLAPFSEAHTEEPELLKLGCESLTLYPKWVEELQVDSGITIDYRVDGTLIVGIEQDDTDQLQHLYKAQQLLELDVQWLTGRKARDIEPSLSPRVSCAIRCDTDYQVDNRLMVNALKHVYQKCGGKLYENCSVKRIEIEDRAAIGIHTEDEYHDADIVILAAGCWSTEIAGIPDNIRPPVRPVKGQMLALQMEDGIELNTVIRTIRARYPTSVYLVPRVDRRLIVGATTEEMGFDTRLTVGGMFELLRGAWEVVPGLYELPIIETWTGLRPGSRDNAPILGTTPIENLIYATGHYRNGILLTPITAYAITELILTGETPDTIKEFKVDRFLT